jgi:hypothetical protein
LILGAVDGEIDGNSSANALFNPRAVDADKGGIIRVVVGDVEGASRDCHSAEVDQDGLLVHALARHVGALKDAF